MHPLTKYINSRRREKAILLMTHVVYGYPSVTESITIMESLLLNGADILEVQFPFSDPVADGPTITTACHQALKNAPCFSQYLQDIVSLSERYPEKQIIPMTYLNPVLQYGIEKLALQKPHGISSIIIPDILQDQRTLLAPLEDAGISPIWLITPGMTDERITALNKHAQGMHYCVSRKGVTGQKSEHDETVDSSMATYLARIRSLTGLPLAVGFGIRSQDDVTALIGEADVAIAGSIFLDEYNIGGLTHVIDKISMLNSTTIA